jgi:signal transduction histidine kinase
MFILQAANSTPVTVFFLGTIGMLVLTIGLVIFIVMHQKKVQRFQQKFQQMEIEQQKMMLNASIKMQEEERQRLAADLHDDAGPLLATARLYLNENLVNQDKVNQLQSIFQARQIIDDTIQLIRNISHDLMPPTLKNFGLALRFPKYSRKIRFDKKPEDSTTSSELIELYKRQVKQNKF